MTATGLVTVDIVLWRGSFSESGAILYRSLGSLLTVLSTWLLCEGSLLSVVVARGVLD